MNNILVGGFELNNTLNIILLSVAVGRIYLEVIGFDFKKLPVSKTVFRDEKSLNRFHKFGLFFAIGHILFSAPQYLLA